MAKKTLSPAGDKISRGANNPALTPSGLPENEEKSFEEVIDSAVGKIIDNLTNGKKTEDEILKSVLSIKRDSVLQPLREFRESFDEKMTALLGAVYGLTSIRTSTSLSQYLSTLGRINTSKTPLADIFKKLDNIVSFDNFQDTMDEMMQVLSDSTKSGKTIDLSSVIKMLDEGLMSARQREAILQDISQKLSGETKTVSESFVHHDVTFNGSLDTKGLEYILELTGKAADGSLGIDALSNELNKLSVLSTIPPVDLSFVDSLKTLQEQLLAFDVDTVDEHIMEMQLVFDDIIKLGNAMNTVPEIKADLSPMYSAIGDYYKLINQVEELSKDAKGSNEQLENAIAHVISIVNNIKDIDVTKEDIKEASLTGDLINAVVGALKIDEEKFANAGSVLRRIIKMTEKPGLMTALHMSDRGLIWQIINNVAEAARGADVTEGSVEGIGKLLDDIISVTDKLDEQKLDKFEDNVTLLNVVLDGDHLQQTLAYIKAIKEQSDPDALENAIKLMKQINKLEAGADFMTIMSLGMKAALGTEAFKLSAVMLMAMSKAGEYADDGKEGLTRIAAALQSISLIKSDTLEKIVSFVESINDINGKLVMTAITAPFAQAGLNALGKEMDSLKELFSSIPEVDSNDNLKAIKDMSDVVSSIGKMNVMLAAEGVLAPLAIVGAYAMLFEMKALVKLTTAVGEMEISDKMHDNLKDLGIIVAASGGILLLAAATGGYVVSHLGDILGFTIALATFSFAIIGALNLATRGMQEAKFNAVEMGELIAISAGIMLLGGTIVTLFPEMILGSMGFALALGAFILTVISAYKYVVTDDIAEIKDRLEDLTAVVAGSAAIMLIGGGLMAAFPMMTVTVPLFTVLLGGFIAGTIYAYKTFGEGIEAALSQAENFGKLIAVSALTLLVGGLLFQESPWMMLTVPLFGLYLTAFVGAVTWAYNTFGQGIEAAQENANKFAILIATSALTLLAGGYLFQASPWMMLTVPLFGIYLAAFVGAVTWAYNTFGNDIGDAIESADKFAILVGVSAAALLVGGYVIQENPWMLLTVPAFGVLLAGFVVAIAWAYDKAADMLTKSIDAAKSLGTLVAITTATLLIGGAFMLIDGMPEAVLEFGAILSVFTLVIGGAYSLFARRSKNVMAAALALSALVVLSGTMLLIGGSMFLENEGLMEASIVFAVTTAVFVGAFALMVWALGQMKLRDLATGLLAVFAITLIIDSFVDTFKKVNEIAQVMDKDKLLDTLEGMAWLVGGTVMLIGVFAGLIAVGALVGSMFGGAGAAVGAIAVASVIGAAEAAAYGVARIIDAIGQAMVSIANASNAWSNIEVPDINKVVEVVGKFTAMTAVIAPLANPATLVLMQLAKSSVASMSSMLVMIGDAVKNISSLRIPLIENGKIVGVRELDENDFDKAADNIEKIITTIGGAIISVYKMHPEIFSSGSTIGDILGMDTEFSRVCKSCAAMGSMIADIAEGVRDYANFRISVYDKNGKKIGSRPFVDADFDSAADNIEKIITTIGGAIIATYEKHPSMFEDTKKWWQPGVRTPFSMVVKSVSGLGKLIGDISKGVQSYAQLRIPVYDENGNVIGSRSMTDADFTAAGDGISKILVTIGSAVIGTYKAFPDMFEGGASLLKDIVGNDFGDNPFIIVKKSFEGTGKLISEAVKAINDVSELKYDIPTARKKISEVLLAVAQSVKDVYDIDPEMFKSSASLLSAIIGNDLSDNPFVTVKKSLEGTGKLIIEAAKAIQSVEKIKVDATTAKQKASLYVTAIAQSIKDAYDIDPDLFEQSSSLLSGILGNDLGNNPFVTVKKSLEGTGKLVIGAAKAIQEVQKIKFDGKIGDKVRFIVSIIPKAILEATVYGKYKEFWEDDALDKTEDIRKAYEKYVGIITNIVGQYKKVYAFVKPNDKGEEANVYLLSNYISEMLRGIAAPFQSIDAEALDTKAIKRILNVYEDYAEGIDEVLGIYKSIWKMLGEAGSEDESRIDVLGKGLVSMIAYMQASLSILTNDGEDSSALLVKINSFASSMETYQDAVRTLAEAFELAPEDFTKYENVQKALNKIHVEIESIPELKRFREESGLMNAYVKTVNSIDTEKVDSLTNLANALTTMSTKLGGLEGLTDVLATKVTNVLSELTERLDQSAATINKAEKIQSERHKKIDEAIKKLKDMMNKPLNVNVTHKAEQQTEVTPGAGTETDTTGARMSGNSTVNTDSFTPAWQKTDSTASSVNNEETLPPSSIRRPDIVDWRNGGVITRNDETPLSMNNDKVQTQGHDQLERADNEAYFDRKAEQAVDDSIKMPNGQEPHSGISARRAREIARQEAVTAIKEWQAKAGRRGGGSHVGAI